MEKTMFGKVLFVGLMGKTKLNAYRY